MAGWRGLAAGGVVASAPSLGRRLQPAHRRCLRRSGSVAAERQARRSAHPLGISRLPVGGVPTAPVLHDSALPRHTLRPAFVIFVERGWGAFGWYDVFFPALGVYHDRPAMLAVPCSAFSAHRREWTIVRSKARERVSCCSCRSPWWRPSRRRTTPRESGRDPGIRRYAFPAIAPLAVLVVGSCMRSDAQDELRGRGPARRDDRA